MDIINARGGLIDRKQGIFVRKVTKDEKKMQVYEANAKRFVKKYSRQK